MQCVHFTHKHNNPADAPDSQAHPLFVVYQNMCQLRYTIWTTSTRNFKTAQKQFSAGNNKNPQLDTVSPPIVVQPFNFVHM